jgi:hypothetical protein
MERSGIRLWARVPLELNVIGVPVGLGLLNPVLAQFAYLVDSPTCEDQCCGATEADESV